MKRAVLTILLLTIAAPSLRADGSASNLWTDFVWPVATTGSTAVIDGLQLIRDQNWAKALTVLESRLFEQPQDAGALHLVGLLFWQAGNREEATRRLVRSTRAPDHQPVTLWALAALSGQARSQAEAVGWIKRASKLSPGAETEQWLRKAYFSNLCEFPPYRELLANLRLSDLCPSTDIAVRYDARRSDPDEMRDLLDRPAPTTSLRLPVQEAPVLQLHLPDKPDGP